MWCEEFRISDFGFRICRWEKSEVDCSRSLPVLGKVVRPSGKTTRANRAHVDSLKFEIRNSKSEILRSTSHGQIRPGKENQAVCIESNKLCFILASKQELRCDRIPAGEGWHICRRKLPRSESSRIAE